jgi:hypothetical protein
VEFTASDITAPRILTGLIAGGTVDEGQAVHFMRLLGRIMSRIAGTQVELVRERLDRAVSARSLGIVGYGVGPQASASPV